jgi:hypothetical protein
MAFAMLLTGEVRERMGTGLTENGGPPDRSWRLGRGAAAVIAGAILVVLGYELAIVVPRALSLGTAIGVDLHQYLGHARSFLETGAFYFDRQLHGPYVIESGDSLYPPTVLYLLVPFLVIPQFLWWGFPLGLIGTLVAATRPRPWAWPLLALILADPRTIEIVMYGNPAMWVGAAVAGALIWSWPGALILLKPSLAPLALIGIRSRGWWLTLAICAVLSAPLAGLYVQFVRVLLDSNGSWSYSVPDVPFVALPLVAWLARTRTPRLRPTRRSKPDASEVNP